jgi:hypothetical protein
MITFTQLIDLVAHVNPDVEEKRMRSVRWICEWLIKTDDNLPLALLYHYLDKFAIEFIGEYSRFLHSELFLYSLTHGNKLFLQ